MKTDIDFSFEYIQFHSMMLSHSQAKAGENVGVRVKNIKKTDVLRGMVLCATKTQTLGNHYDASVYMLAKNEGGRHKPIVSKFTNVLFSQTWSIPCRIDLRKFRSIKRFYADFYWF